VKRKRRASLSISGRFATVMVTMAADPSRRSFPNHPLLQERARLDAILDVMYLEIQKILNPRRRPSSRSGAEDGRGTEQALVGGESADDVLQAAAMALLSYPPARLKTTWEALSVRIAQNKAIQALRTATKGRRSSGGDAPDREINVVPLSSGDNDQDLIDTLSDADEDLEAIFIETQQQQILLRLARELLNDRDRQIFYAIHYLDTPRAELGRTLGLTGQRVGQIYRAAAERLLNAAHNDPTFRNFSDFTERRTR